MNYCDFDFHLLPNIYKIIYEQVAQTILRKVCDEKNSSIIDSYFIRCRKKNCSIIYSH